MKKLIIANWKCNPASLKQAISLTRSFKKRAAKSRAEAVICPPFVYLPVVKSQLLKNVVKLGAQNCFWEEKGAYTGEISPNMLADLGVKYVLIGHSEREQNLCEDNKMANKKISLCLARGLIPVLCVGETEAERKSGQTFNALEKELSECLAGIPKAKLSCVAIAYEPIWAIGSGNPCSPDEALTAVLFIRKTIAAIAAKKSLADDIKVLYGGSVSGKNAKDYLNNHWISGLLLGGSSLIEKEFSAILKEVK